MRVNAMLYNILYEMRTDQFYYTNYYCSNKIASDKAFKSRCAIVFMAKCSIKVNDLNWNRFVFGVLNSLFSTHNIWVLWTRMKIIVCYWIWSIAASSSSSIMLIFIFSASFWEMFLIMKWNQLFPLSVNGTALLVIQFNSFHQEKLVVFGDDATVNTGNQRMNGKLKKRR